MATASGNKVGISKRRQNDNEEGELKRYDNGDKESKYTTLHKMQSSSKGNENDKAVKLIPERNDSSTRVSSKLSSLQMFSAVISLLEGEAGRFADRWFCGPYYHYSSHRQPSSLYCRNFLRRLSKHATE